MDDWLNDALPVEERRGSVVVTRYGSRIQNGALRKCAVTHCRSVIILSEGLDPDEADSAIVRTTLALTAGLAPEERPR